MHFSSFNEMKYFMDRYLEKDKQLNILDIGSMSVSDGMQATYKDLMQENWKYTGLDMAEGKNVDIVVKNPYKWEEVESEKFDVVISGQMLEHTKYPWLVIQEIVRVTKNRGLICVIVPSGGGEHKFPLDCYRFFPDGMRALAELANIGIIECYCDNIEPWKDTIMIGRK